MDEKEEPSRRRIKGDRGWKVTAGVVLGQQGIKLKYVLQSTDFQVSTSENHHNLCCGRRNEKVGVVASTEPCEKGDIGSITGSGRELVHWRCIVETDGAVIQH